MYQGKAIWSKLFRTTDWAKGRVMASTIKEKVDEMVSPYRAKTKIIHQKFNNKKTEFMVGGEFAPDVFRKPITIEICVSSEKGYVYFTKKKKERFLFLQSPAVPAERRGGAFSAAADGGKRRVPAVGVTADGSSRDATTTMPGERIYRTFPVSAGRRIWVRVTSSDKRMAVSILAPGGAVLASDTANGNETLLDLEAPDVATGGTYTLVIDPSGGTTGTFTFVLSAIDEVPVQIGRAHV